MAEQSPSPKAPGARPLLLPVALFVVALLAVGGYFLFLRDEPPPAGTPVAAVVPGDEALVGGGHIGDLQAFLDRSIPADASGRVSYQVQGNKLLNLSSTSADGRTTITADEVEFKALDSEHETPYFADVRIKGMTITPAAGTLPGGYDSLDLDLVYAYAYDATARTLSVPAVAIDLKGLARINLSGSFSGLEGAPSDPVSALLSGARIDRFDLTIDDQTLFKVLLQAAAQRQGTDLATLAASGAESAAQLEQSTDDPLVRQFAAAAKVILQKIENVTVTLTAAPARPFPLAGVVGAFMTGGLPDSEALKDLNLTVMAQ